MHLAFIPYGPRESVEWLLRQMEAQKHALLFWKKDDPKAQKPIYIPGAIRMLPLGIYEYIFPRESLQLVLNSLRPGGDKERYPFVGWLRLAALRKAFALKSIPRQEDLK